MGTHILVNGHPTWVDVRSEGEHTVLLLHGGMSHSDLMFMALGSLADTYRLAAFDRKGHGFTADGDGTWHYDDMATETIAVLESVLGGPAHLIGYSDGGIVALLVALRRPDLVDRMVVIGTNFHASGLSPGFLDAIASSPLMLEQLAKDYEERSPGGADLAPIAFDKFLTMARAEPTLTGDDLARIDAPTLVLAGDDEAITHAHTCALFEALPQGQLAIVPAASHACLVEHVELTNALIRSFLTRPVPPVTYFPVRRRRPVAP